MESTPPTPSPSTLHPMLWVAGISVTLLSLAGIAALTGFLPMRSTTTPERPAIVAVAPASEPVAPAPPVVAAPPVPERPVSKAPAVSPHKTVKRKVELAAPADSHPLPPPLASGVPPDYVPPPGPAAVAPAPTPCADCGVIANVRQVSHEGQGSGAGAVLGGLAGGALASNVGRGNTRTLATIAGAIGGGLLGNNIEKSQKQTVGYEVTVRLENGTTRQIEAESVPTWRIGDKVRLVDGAIVAR